MNLGTNWIKRKIKQIKTKNMKTIQICNTIMKFKTKMMNYKTKINSYKLKIMNCKNRINSKRNLLKTQSKISSSTIMKSSNYNLKTKI